MNANWYGALGETFRDRIGRVGDSEALSGIVGSPVDHHSAPFSLTEEFVTVYRLHPLIPDDWNWFSLESGEHPAQHQLHRDPRQVHPRLHA